MYWFPLRKNNIPLVDRQVESALKTYNTIRQSIMQGDILSIQKMSEFELSVRIKKRIQEMDEFYNQNCLDERVRFLQGARMKLVRLLNQSTLIQKQKYIGLPWKNNNQLAGSRASNQKKSITPRKNTARISVQQNQRQADLSNKQKSKSPINETANNKDKTGKNKLNLSLQIPQESSQNQPKFQKQKIQKNLQKAAQPSQQTKTSRKQQYIPQKNQPSQSRGTNLSLRGASEKQQEQPKIKISEPPSQVPKSSRSKVSSNAPGKIRTMTEGNSSNSIKKLNDLIFTIKMTKEEYEDFIEIKKKLNDY